MIVSMLVVLAALALSVMPALAGTITSGTITLTVRQNDASAVPSTTKVGNTLYVSGKSTGYNNVQVILADAAGDGLTNTATVENTTVGGTKLTVTLSETATSGGTGLVQYVGTFFVATTTTAETSTTAGNGIIGASDGDLISVASGDVARLTVDSKGPKITGESPADDAVTRATTIDFVATVTDAGSGLVADSADVDGDGVKTEPITVAAGTTTNINIQIDPASAGVVATGTENSNRALWATATDGYSFTFAKVMTEAAHTWFIKATDRVGNSDQTDSDADVTSDQDNSFTVDATAAIMGIVTTGIKWDATNKDEDPSRSHIKVEFTATGGTTVDNMDTSTLAAGDFLVDGLAIAGMVHPNLKSTKGVDLAGVAMATKNIVYLELSADLAADAKPKVSLVGTVNDLAGNASAIGEKKATDGNTPKFTVTITGNADASGRPVVQGDTDDKITVRIASDETLTAAPTIKFGTLAWDASQSGGARLEVAASASVTPSSVSGLTNTWETSKLKADIGNADGLYSVYVSGVDLSTNTGTSGSGSAAAGAVDLTKANLFEIDNNIGAPSFTLTPNTGAGAGTTTESTGPFIRIDVSEAKEYNINSVDKLDFGSPAVSVEIDDHDDITISAITLNGDDVSTSLGSVDSDSYVLATSGLAVGEHELKVSYNDSVGNKLEDQEYDFTVDERSDYEVKLSPGWNLVSVPGTPAASAIDDVIGSTHPATSVLTYESGEWKVATRGTDNAWEGTISQIDSDHAYWVQTGSFDSIKTLINERDPATILPTITIKAGWNLVPVVDLAQTSAPTQAQLAAGSHGFTAAAYFASLTWTVAYGFDTQANEWRKITSTTGDRIGQGKGYWVWATKAGELVP
jgi:hypothetical protein